MLDDFFELHGDRGRMDDHAIVAGIGKLDGRTIALLGHQKGRDLKERTTRNFGMAYPEGYRKAMRVMELAEQHGFPLITLVDTPGAYPGVAAEQHGQGGAIARSQAVMLRLGVPHGRGRDRRGRLGRRDRDCRRRPRADAGERDLLGDLTRRMCRDPLARRRRRRRRPPSAFKPDAAHCLDLGVIDGIVPEPEGGAQTDPEQAAALLSEALVCASRRARRHPAGRSPPGAAREVPRHGRPRLARVSPHYPQAYPRPKMAS